MSALSSQQQLCLDLLARLYDRSEKLYGKGHGDQIDLGLASLAPAMGTTHEGAAQTAASLVRKQLVCRHKVAGLVRFALTPAGRREADPRRLDSIEVAS